MPRLHYRHVANQAQETLLYMLERPKNINWHLILGEYHNQLSALKMALPEKAHDSFLNYLRNTKVLGPRETTQMLRCLSKRKTTTWDLVFFAIERDLPFRPNTQNTLKPDIPFPRFSGNEILDSLRFYIEYNPKTQEDAKFIQELPNILPPNFSVIAHYSPQMSQHGFTPATKKRLHLEIILKT